MRLTHGRGYITGLNQLKHRRAPSVCRPSLRAEWAAVRWMEGHHLLELGTVPLDLL